jgi:hypothetical protein
MKLRGKKRNLFSGDDLSLSGNVTNINRPSFPTKNEK